MGLLSHIVGAPVNLPLSTFRWLAGKIHEQALEIYADPNRITTALMALEASLDRGEIDEAEYDAQEALLLAELKEIKTFKKQLEETAG